MSSYLNPTTGTVMANHISLRSFGYSTAVPARARKAALEDAIEAHGKRHIVDRLNFVWNLQIEGSTPKDRMSQDIEWLKSEPQQVMMLPVMQAPLGVSLRGFGYSTKDAVEVRRASIERAIMVHGKPSVEERLKFVMSIQSSGYVKDTMTEDLTWLLAPPPKEDTAISLRSFQYSSKKNGDERHSALASAVNIHGKDAIVNRLKQVMALQGDGPVKDIMMADMAWLTVADDVIEESVTNSAPPVVSYEVEQPISLKKVGYKTKNRLLMRRISLNKAVKMYGKEAVVKRMEFVIGLQAVNSETWKVMACDLAWLRLPTDAVQLRKYGYNAMKPRIERRSAILRAIDAVQNKAAVVRRLEHVFALQSRGGINWINMKCDLAWIDEQLRNNKRCRIEM